MTESRRPRRDGERPAGKGTGGGPRGGDSSGRGTGQGAGQRREGKPFNRRDGKPVAPRRDGKPADARRDRRQDAEERTDAQRVYDGPPIPDDLSAKDLDKHARQALQSLPEKLADKVARHLVMAGLLIHDNPEEAHLHALAARARATRTGLVREACGETAYASGKFAEALSEFRAARRMNGSYSYSPMMADCERALKRPDKAIAYDTPAVRGHLDDAGQIELSIVVAGARRDQGQVDAAIRLLETEPLHTKSRGDWVPRLRYAYADALLDAGRRDDALEWFHRTVAVDGNAQTDAAERLAELE